MVLCETWAVVAAQRVRRVGGQLSSNSGFGSHGVGYATGMRLTPRTLRHPIRSLFRRSITSAVAVALWENRERIIGRAKGVLAGRRHVADVTRPAGDPWVPADRRPPTLFEAIKTDEGISGSPEKGKQFDPKQFDSKQFDPRSAKAVRDINDRDITGRDITGKAAGA